MYLPNGPTISEFSPTRTKLVFVFLTQFQILISISIKYVITKQVTACRTCEIARGSWDVVICPIYMCLHGCIWVAFYFVWFYFVYFMIFMSFELLVSSVIYGLQAQVTAESRLAVTILVTVSSRWSRGELTVSSHGGQFFSHGLS